MIEKLQTLINRINIFGDKSSDSTGLTNQSLVKQIESHFLNRLEHQSFDNQMLYDCSFLVIMAPDDYHRAKLRFPQIVKGVVTRFYKVIQKKKSKYKEYLPAGNYWYFQFIPLPQDTQAKDGTVTIISTATSLKQDWGETLNQNLISSELINVSVNGQHSKYSKYDLNLETLGGVDVLEVGKMRLKFNKQLLFSDEDILKEEAFGTLSFEQNYTKKSYNIVSNYVEVGLAKRKEEGITTSRLNIFEPNSSLQQDHFAIRYDMGHNAFYIALFAPARVNEELLTVSKDKNNPEWHRLKQKSSILCGMFQVNFEALV